MDIPIQILKKLKKKLSKKRKLAESEEKPEEEKVYTNIIKLQYGL